MRFFAVFSIVLLVAACDRTTDSTQVEHTHAEPIGHAECAACGMLVGAQPAPRAQVIHRDGTRKYLCSISDLLHYSEAPSPSGRILQTFVEVMEPEADPEQASTQERPWIEASEASYVVGIHRGMVMGEPAMTYRTVVEAEAAASRFEGSVIPWSKLRRRLYDN